MSDPLRNATLRQLRAFAAAVATGSLTGAAQQLGVTQPAISLQVQNLRRLAGLPLLLRAQDRVVPTDAGRALLTLEERVNRALDDCIQELETIRGATGGRVALGAVSTAKYFVPAAMGAFARRHPMIELKLSIGNRAQVIQGLRDFTLDGAITGRPPDDLDLEKRLIGDHPHLIIAPAGHPLAARRRLPLSVLAAERFIIREPGSGTRMLMQRLFEDVGLSPNVVMEIDSNETIKQAVMAGLGVALLSGHTVAREIADGRLVALDVVGLPIVRQWFVVYRRDRHVLPPAAALLEFLASEAAEFLPGAEGRPEGGGKERPDLAMG